MGAVGRTETKLCLRVGIQNKKSTITERYFTSPLKLGTPRSASDRLLIVLMMASAGVLKGDRFSYDIKCDAGTKSKITEQSYTKIFDTGDGAAFRKQQITLNGNASLYYRPSAVIPFQNSTFDGENDIYLDENSEFAWSDIMTAGRIAMNEQFLFKHYRNRVRVFINNKLIWMDHCLLEPAHMDTNGMLFFDQYTHQGTFYYYGANNKQCKILEWYKTYMESLNKHHIEKMCKSQAVRIGVSEACRGICVRVLANTAQDIEELFSELASQLEIND